MWRHLTWRWSSCQFHCRTNNPERAGQKKKARAKRERAREREYSIRAEGVRKLLPDTVRFRRQGTTPIPHHYHVRRSGVFIWVVWRSSLPSGTGAPPPPPLPRSLSPSLQRPIPRPLRRQSAAPTPLLQPLRRTSLRPRVSSPLPPRLLFGPGPPRLPRGPRWPCEPSWEGAANAPADGGAPSYRAAPAATRAGGASLPLWVVPRHLPCLWIAPPLRGAASGAPFSSCPRRHQTPRQRASPEQKERKNSRRAKGMEMEKIERVRFTWSST